MKILVIEDEKLLAQSIRGVLEQKGFTVETVCDGELLMLARALHVSMEWLCGAEE